MDGVCGRGITRIAWVARIATVQNAQLKFIWCSLDFGASFKALTAL